MWDDLKGQFINHLDQVNADLEAAGLPGLGDELSQKVGPNGKYIRSLVSGR